MDPQMVEQCFDETWTYVACGDSQPCEHCGVLATHHDSIIISVSGACPGNGGTGATAAAGIFLAAKSRYNRSVIVPFDNATNQVAELWAALQALEQASNIRYEGVRGATLRQVIIKSDSAYLVNGMTDWVFKWEKNGYKNSKGKKIVNEQHFKLLEEWVGLLKEAGVEVLFWQVPRTRNQEADKLASLALKNHLRESQTQ